MTEALNQRELLARYFLGVASDMERRAVEEQFLAADADLNDFLQAEDELIDDYVRGALSTSDRRLFEINFLCTKTRRHRLELVQTLVDVLAELDSERFVSSERLSRSLPLQERGAGSRPVTLRNQLSLASFTELLQWLDADREKAAEKYEAIRNRLITIFASRGFDNPDELADDTVDRVASRAAQLIDTYVGDPMRYFLGVARAVMREGSRRPTRDLMPSASLSNENVSDQTHNCLEKCLQQLSESNRDLMLQYYGTEKHAKVAKRIELAQSLGVSPNALQLKVYTIRRQLQACVRACLKGQSQ